MSIAVLPHLAPVARSKAAWLVDIWGVLHNGVAAFPSAVAALKTYRAQGGKVLLISNAPRPAHAVVPQLDKVGVPREAYDEILTSGDVTRALLTAKGQAKAYHLGPERDLGIYEGLSLQRVENDSAAELIVCTGLFDDTTETPETYRAQLTKLHARNIPMVCANPDLKVERGGQIIPCAGAVAKLYETLGGKVTYAGKPHGPIYDMAMERVSDMIGRTATKSDVLCIGDGMLTDIAGAHGYGLPMLFIASQVHVAGELTPEKLDALFKPTPYRPIGAQSELTW
jgi:HAD superfamily hydrolase (TIGR01459 family)